MRKALIFGAGDFAQIAYAYLRDDSDYDVVAFTADKQHITESTFMGKPLISFERVVKSHPATDYVLFIGVGYSKVNKNRRTVFERCSAAGYELPTYLHSSVRQWPETQIGAACFILENNVIQPFVTIGNDCVLWSGSNVSHHSIIEDHVFVASHATILGRCKIGEGSFVGANATFRDHVTVGRNCVIGAGAIVLKDTVESGVYKATNTVPLEIRSDELRNL